MEPNVITITVSDIEITPEIPSNIAIRLHAVRPMNLSAPKSNAESVVARMLNQSLDPKKVFGFSKDGGLIEKPALPKSTKIAKWDDFEAELRCAWRARRRIPARVLPQPGNHAGLCMNITPANPKRRKPRSHYWMVATPTGEEIPHSFACHRSKAIQRFGGDPQYGYAGGWKFWHRKGYRAVKVTLGKAPPSP